MKLRNHFLIWVFFLCNSVYLGEGIFAQTYANQELHRVADSINSIKHYPVKEDSSSIRQEQDSPYKADNGAFQIHNIEVVNYDREYSKERINSFLSEAHSELLINDFFVDLSKSEFVIVNRNDRTAHRIFKFTIHDKSLQFLCETCSLPNVKIIQMDQDRLILDMPNQDESNSFDFRFIFKKP